MTHPTPHNGRVARRTVLHTLLFGAGLGGFGLLLFQLNWLGGAVLLALLASPLLGLFNTRLPQSGLRLSRMLKRFKAPAAFLENRLQVLNQLEALAQLSRQHGLIALEETLNFPESYSHPHLHACLGVALEASQAQALHEWMQTRSRSTLNSFDEALETFGQLGRRLTPVACALNVLCVLLALKGLFSVEMALNSFLWTAGAYGLNRSIWAPTLAQLRQAREEEACQHRMIHQGVLAIWKQQHPQAIRQSLEAYVLAH